MGMAQDREALDQVVLLRSRRGRRRRLNQQRKLILRKLFSSGETHMPRIRPDKIKRTKLYSNSSSSTSNSSRCSSSSNYSISSSCRDSRRIYSTSSNCNLTQSQPRRQRRLSGQDSRCRDRCNLCNSSNRCSRYNRCNSNRCRDINKCSSSRCSSSRRVEEECTTSMVKENWFQSKASCTQSTAQWRNAVRFRCSPRLRSRKQNPQHRYCRSPVFSRWCRRCSRCSSSNNGVSTSTKQWGGTSIADIDYLVITHKARDLQRNRFWCS